MPNSRRSKDRQETYRNYCLALARVSNLADGLISPAKEANLKASISSYYDTVVDESPETTGWMWNWGLYDPGLERELNARGDQAGTETDGFSEQLYYSTIRRLPNYPDFTGTTFLEVGCGRGIGLNWLSRLVHPSCRLVGVDFSARAIENATLAYADGRRLQFVEGEAANLPLADRSVDVIISVESAHNYPNLRDFLREVTRVLKPGGFFSCVDVFTASRRRALELLQQESLGLTWISDTDISDDVRSSIRQRMAPDSTFRSATGLTHPSARDIGWGDFFAGIANGEYVGLQNIQAPAMFPIESYLHHIAQTRR